MKIINQTSLVDAFQRKVTYLRLSVTDRCNLSCCYCAPSRPRLLPMDRLLSFEEMLRLVNIGVGLGITKVRLTGGEPLCREGITGFVQKISRIPEIREVSLTTNGVYLKKKAAGLKQAGMNRINVSLDTLEPAKFRKITGKDHWKDVWEGIMEAMSLGFSPVKINTVVMKGVNDDEVEALADLSRQYPLHVRFIEYMPIGTDPRAAGEFFVSGTELKKRMAARGELLALQKNKSDGPARRFKFRDAPGEIGFISSMSDHFCDQCNRIRLTARGFLRPCLLADDQVDLIRQLRDGADDEQLRDQFLWALSLKRGEHGLNFNGADALKTKMVSIGG